MSVTPTLERLRQDDRELKASLAYVVRSSPAHMALDLVSKIGIERSFCCVLGPMSSAGTIAQSKLISMDIYH